MTKGSVACSIRVPLAYFKKGVQLSKMGIVNMKPNKSNVRLPKLREHLGGICSDLNRKYPKNKFIKRLIIILSWFQISCLKFQLPNGYRYRRIVSRSQQDQLVSMYPHHSLLWVYGQVYLFYKDRRILTRSGMNG